jgi:hypothetical protein
MPAVAEAGPAIRTGAAMMSVTKIGPARRARVVTSAVEDASRLDTHELQRATATG